MVVLRVLMSEGQILAPSGPTKRRYKVGDLVDIVPRPVLSTSGGPCPRCKGTGEVFAHCERVPSPCDACGGLSEERRKGPLFGTIARCPKGESHVVKLSGGGRYYADISELRPREPDAQGVSVGGSNGE